VAAFCTRCGAALAPGVQFCTSCGTPAGAVAPPGVVSGAVYGQPGAAPVQPAPGGSGAVKIILIVVAVIVGLGILSGMAFMFGVWRLSHAVHVSNSGDVVLSAPNGSISTGSSGVSAADLGVPIYPGASRQAGGMQINTATGSMVTVVFSTTDPIDKVVDFYKGKLGDNASVIQSPTGAVISAGEKNKQGVVITVGTDNSNGGATTIAIMRTKSK